MPAACGASVPRLIVQPLIENAFGHGLKNVEKDGIAMISLQCTESEIDISIEDSGDALSGSALEALRRSVTEGPPTENDSVALVNIHRRLQLHFGEQSGLLFERSSLGGLKVTIRVVPGEGRDANGADPAGG